MGPVARVHPHRGRQVRGRRSPPALGAAAVEATLRTPLNSHCCPSADGLDPRRGHGLGFVGDDRIMAFPPPALNLLV
jgi:hypothetical protein